MLSYFRRCSVLAIGLFNAIMFPAIFSLAREKLSGPSAAYTARCSYRRSTMRA
jgi:fucose permease